MSTSKTQTPVQNTTDQNAARDTGKANKNQTPDPKDSRLPKQAPGQETELETEYDENEHENNSPANEKREANNPSRIDTTEEPERKNDPTRIRPDANDPTRVDPTRISNK